MSLIIVRGIAKICFFSKQETSIINIILFLGLKVNSLTYDFTALYQKHILEFCLKNEIHVYNVEKVTHIFQQLNSTFSLDLWMKKGQIFFFVCELALLLSDKVLSFFKKMLGKQFGINSLYVDILVYISLIVGAQSRFVKLPLMVTSQSRELEMALWSHNVFFMKSG